MIGADAGAPDVGRLAEQGVEVHLDDQGDQLLDGVATRGIAVLGELEPAWRLLPNPFVAVTGTNGKTAAHGAARGGEVVEAL